MVRVAGGSAEGAAGFDDRLRIPCSVLGLRTTPGALTALEFLPLETPESAPATALAERAVEQLRRYLDDPEFAFDLPLAPAGTQFQQRVWQALRAIPCGSASTYGELAARLRSSARAVGGACGANPIALIVPCHRVVARDGTLGGFMGHTDGHPLAIKRWLLAHERARIG
jgi:methylated-DNA-[protein]-cysteine S-methyltransferase